MLSLNVDTDTHSAHILVFDSGLGGTTILTALKKQLPQCSFSYAMDNAVFPYGGQTDAFLLQRCGPLFAKLIAHEQPRSEEHTSELQSRPHIVCRLLLEKKKGKAPAVRPCGPRLSATATQDGLS